MSYTFPDLIALQPVTVDSFTNERTLGAVIYVLAQIEHNGSAGFSKEGLSQDGKTANMSNVALVPKDTVVKIGDVLKEIRVKKETISTPKEYTVRDVRLLGGSRVTSKEVYYG